METRIYRMVLITFIALFTIALYSCGGSDGDGGSVTNQTPTEATWVAGTLETTQQVRNICPDFTEDRTDYETYEITQDGNDITVTNQGNTYYGTVNGNQISWSGNMQEDGGTTTINSLSLTITGDTFSGTATWTWTDGETTCSGTTQITGNRTYTPPEPELEPEPEPEPTANQPLTFFEEELVGKWYRYHSYDGSSYYLIFNADRTGCKWEEDYGINRRENKTTYHYWELVDLGSNNAFTISYRTAPGGDLIEGANKYFYNTDEIWLGGYSNLVLGRSTTEKVCE